MPDDRPPTHFSPQDPWAEYRRAILTTQAHDNQRQQQQAAASLSLLGGDHLSMHMAAHPPAYYPGAGFKLFPSTAYIPEAASVYPDRPLGPPLPVAGAVPMRMPAHAPLPQQQPLMPIATLRNSLRGSSLHRGVSWDVQSHAWRAKIKVKGKTWYLGMYKSEIEAAQSYDAASWFVSGAKAIVNFLSVSYDLVDPPRAPPPWLIQRLIEVVRRFVCDDVLTTPGREGRCDYEQCLLPMDASTSRGRYGHRQSGCGQHAGTTNNFVPPKAGKRRSCHYLSNDSGNGTRG
jgi:hypothetical protein